MLDKLAEVEKRYGELEDCLADPKLVENQKARRDAQRARDARAGDPLRR